MTQTQQITRRVESQPPANAMDGFQASAGDVAGLAIHVGAAAAVAREEAELKAAIVLARSNPRNELAAFEKIMKACTRPTFADDAAYKYPRGGQEVRGPSVYLAREMARIWGNIRSGIRIVSADREFVHVKGYCHDLESNAYKESESKFRALVQRKDRESGETRWITPDERDLRELVNKHGAICERNAILQTLPADYVEDALVQAEKTLIAFKRRELDENRGDVVKRLVLTYSDISVSADMLAQYLGHPLEQINAEELASLRAIYKSIRDGQAKREEFFGAVKPASTPPGMSAADALANKIKQQQQQQTPPDDATKAKLAEIEKKRETVKEANTPREEGASIENGTGQGPDTEAAGTLGSPSTNEAGGTSGSAPRSRQPGEDDDEPAPAPEKPKGIGDANAQPPAGALYDDTTKRGKPRTK